MTGMGEPEGIKLFIGQVPRDYGKKDLLLIFEPYGDIHSLDLLVDKATGHHKGCAFLTYQSNESAKAAQDDLHEKKTLPGARNVMQVKPAASEGNIDNRKLFCGMLTKSLTEDDLTNMFSSFGKIEDVMIIKTSEGISKGCAFVTYETRAQAQNAIRNLHHSEKMEGCSSPMVVKVADTNKDKMTKHMIKQTAVAAGAVGMAGGMTGGGTVGLSTVAQLQQQVAYYQQLFTQIALPQFVAGNFGATIATQGQSIDQQSLGSMSTGILQNQLAHPYAGFQQYATTQQQMNTPVDNKQSVGPDGANLIIYQIPPEYTDTNLMQLFMPFGNVISAKVFLDKATQRSRGFGFVSYENAKSASNAITAMNGFVIGSARLRVQLKRKKETKPY